MFVKGITLQVDFFHNLEPQQIICISFEIIELMYHSVVKVKKIAGLSFSKLSFKVVFAYMLL